jgi:Tol biopolymer transport system component/DNA-binding winged helix-turn-helix (wHTH) protein
MARRMPGGERYEFGPFRLDAAERVLTRGGEAVPLPPKVFETLLVLVANSGRVLGKDELLSALWPDSFVEESNLAQNISQLRKALGEGAAGAQFIETVPKRGYRFTAQVRLVGEEAQVSTPARHAEGRDAFAPLAEERREPDAASGNGHAAAEADEREANGGATANGARAAARPQNLTGPHGLRRRPLLALLVVAAVAAGAALYLMILRRQAARHADAAFRPMNISRLTSSGRARQPALSPDSRHVAYVMDEAGKQSLWVRQVATASNVMVVDPAEVSYRGLTFSPDSNFIYYVVVDEERGFGVLYQIPLLGGTPRKVMERVGSPVAFSPDGRQMAFVRGNPAQRETMLLVANADGTAERKLVTRAQPEFLSRQGPSWSPDGRLIACAAGRSDAGDTTMHVLAVNPGDGSAQPVGAETWTTVGRVAWLGDGSGLALGAWRRASAVFGDQLWLLTYPGGEARRVTNDMSSYEGVSVSADSAALVSERTERVSSVWVIPDSDTNRATQIRSGFGDNYSERFGLDWTPDGRLVYASHASGNLDLWVAATDGSEPRQLTREAQADIAPSVSADGRFVAFISYRSGAAHVWRIGVDGGDAKQVTLTGGADSPSVSPDGRWVAYSLLADGRWGVWKATADGGETVRLTKNLAGRPAFSPDGKLIACQYQDEKDRRVKVALIRASDGELVKIFERMPQPEWGIIRWSADGRALTYIETRADVSNIWAQPVDGGAPKQLTDFKTDRIFRFAWSRDGKQLACERGTAINEVVLIRSGTPQ